MNFGPTKFKDEYVWKKYHKNELHSCLVTHRLTKLSQNLYLINTHIFMYRYARCSCNLWISPWFDCVFWVFSYFFKLSLVVCLINLNILVCQNAKCTAGYGRFTDLIEFLGNFHILLHVWNVITSPNFHKLCVSYVGMKNKPMLPFMIKSVYFLDNF